MHRISDAGAVPRPIRVLHICEAFDPGGVVWWLADMAKMIPRSEYAFDFYCSGSAPGLRAQEVLDRGCGIVLFQPGISEVLRGAGLRAVLRSKRYDIVHAHTFNLSGWLLRHAHRAGVKLRIAHFHNTDDGRPNSLAVGLRRGAGRYMIRRYANALLACSQPALDRAPRPKECLLRAVLSYGIDTERFAGGCRGTGLRRTLGLGATTPVVSHVGRFCPQKNHAALIDIFRLVAHELPDACLVLVGDGPLIGDARERVHALGLANRVRFLGARLDVDELLRESDVLCFPSLHEGMGIAVLEARMAGVPVVASALPAIAEALAGCNGFRLVPCGDNREFAQAIVGYLRNRRSIPPPASWKALFSRERSAAELLACYERLINGSAAQ